MSRTFPFLRAVLLLALILVACNATPSPAPTDELGTLALPTVDTRAFQACAGVGTEAVLAGDANDPRVAWLVSGGKRLDVVFPHGSRARFTPGLEVLNASGAVVARAGDRIDGGCVTAGPLLILWP
jgi:hypothetical protein